MHLGAHLDVLLGLGANLGVNLGVNLGLQMPHEHFEGCGRVQRDGAAARGEYEREQNPVHPPPLPPPPLRPLSLLPITKGTRLNGRHIGRPPDQLGDRHEHLGAPLCVLERPTKQVEHPRDRALLVSAPLGVEWHKPCSPREERERRNRLQRLSAVLHACRELVPTRRHEAA